MASSSCETPVRPSRDENRLNVVLGREGGENPVTAPAMNRPVPAKPLPSAGSGIM
jgi:hypothetical protein